jgi:tripartite-type tricarboxylate transporter receptor subunit TctC
MIKSKLLAAALFMAALIPSARADDNWASHLTFVIHADQTGGMDAAARAIGKSIGRSLGSVAEFRNMPGASGQIASQYVLKAPDDCTVLYPVNVDTVTFMNTLTGLVPNWNDAFAWVGTFVVDPGNLAVSINAPWKNIQEFIDAAKTKKMRIAVANWRQSYALALQELADQTGAQFEIIPMPASQSTTALLGGHIEGLVRTSASLKPLEGSVRYLGQFQEKNLTPNLTDNAPAINAALGTHILDAASYRALSVRMGCKTKYPDRFEAIQKAFHAAFSEPAFQEEAKGVGIAPSLVEWNADETQAAADKITKAVEAHKDLFR